MNRGKRHNGDWMAHKLQHFFSSFPSAPSTLISSNMGNVIPGASGKRPSRKTKRSTKGISDLAYKNTWSSLLKTSQADGLQLSFFPTKSPVFQSSILKYGKSFDDDDLIYYRRGLGKVEFDLPYRRVRSASPVRQRNRNSKIQNFSDLDPITWPGKRPVSPYIIEKFISEAARQISLNLYTPMLSKKDSLEVNVSSACESMDVNTSNGRSTFDSMGVNASSTLTYSGNSIEAHPSMSSNQINSSIEVAQVSSSADPPTSANSMLVNITSSPPTSGSSMLNNVSSSSDNVERIVARILTNESSALTSCSRRLHRPSHNPYGQEWTRRFLYTLPVPTHTPRVELPSPCRSPLHQPPVDLKKYCSSPELRDLCIWQNWRDFTGDKFLTQHRSRRVIAELAREKALEEEAYRNLRKEVRSLAMQRSCSLPRAASAHSFRKTTNSEEYGQRRAQSGRRRIKSTTASDLDKELHANKAQNMTTNLRPMQSRPKKEAKERSSSMAEDTNDCKFIKSRESRQMKSPSIEKKKQEIAALQPASGDNIASVLRRAMARKKYEQEELIYAVERQRETDRRQRIRALRLDPAWKKASGAGAKVADQDILARKCYKEVVERERLMQYHMEMEEMLTRVWQMPPLFDRLPKHPERYMFDAMEDGRYNSHTKSRPNTSCQLRKAYSPIRQTLINSPLSIEKLDSKKATANLREEKTRPSTGKERKSKS